MKENAFLCEAQMSATIGYHLVKQNNLTLSLLSSYRMAGYDSGDSDFFRGMADRDGTLEAELQVFLSTSLGQLSVTC
jgi:hypothetical protein